MSRKRVVILSLVAIAVIAVGIILVRFVRPASNAPRGGPNVLLVTLDTTRADRIGAYGWRHGRTPTLDHLAKEGIIFTRAYSSVPMTLPSHTTIMTGLYPFYHGVRDNSGFELDPRARTLAEIFNDHQYQTGAVVAAFVLDARFGLNQGFAEYRDRIPSRAQFERFEVPERNAERIVDDALDWMSTLQKDRPFFLWCHFYDPHHPYQTPETFPFYLSHPYDLEIAFTDFQLQRLLDHLGQSPPNDRPTLIVVVADHGEGLGEHGEETHAYFTYDSTLHVPVIVKLPNGSKGGTTIDAPISLADIMPTILDLTGLPVPHEDEIHGRSLVGLLEGEPGAQAAFRQRPIYFESYAPMYGFGWAPVRGIRVDQTKYIESPDPELYLLADNPREGQPRNVYDQNPDVVAEMAEALKQLLETPLRTPALSGEMTAADPEVVQKLRSLGYVAGPVNGETQWTADDDLKHRLPLYNRIQAVSSQIEGGDVAAAASTLIEVLGDDPDNPRALMVLGEAASTNPDEAAPGLSVLEAAAENPELSVAMRAPLLTDCGLAYLTKEDPQRALAFLRQAAELEPENPTAHGWVSTAYLHLGRPNDALEAARRAVACGPQGEFHRVLLGLTEFCAGQPKEAAAEWQRLLDGKRKALPAWELAAMCARDRVIAAKAREVLSQAAADPSLPESVRGVLHAAHGQILFNEGQYAPALAAFDAACSLLGDDVAGLWWRSRALTALQRFDEARHLLEQAKEKRPDRIEVVADLALLQHQNGDTAAAVQALEAYYESHSDDPTAANNLAWMLAESAQGEEDLERALALAKFAVKRRRSSYAFHDTLGWVHLKLNDADSAIYAFSRATHLQPDNATYQYHLGLAYRLDGQMDKAREAFAAAVDLAPTPRPDWYDEAQGGSVISSDGNAGS